MTEREAIEMLEKLFLRGDEKEIHVDGEKLDEALEFAVKALEKQIPKKVEVWADGTQHCPCCEKDNTSLCFPVCVECGQKLDWSEEE